jgi:hypothetical protein
MTHGIQHTLALSDIIPTVMDIHHHWIREGEYIDPRDDRCKRVIDSWRGHRPVLHYSCSREDILTGHDENTRPDHALLLEAGFKKQKLRAHSDFYWNQATTDWALGFWDSFDIQCESKGKNLASFKVYERAKQLGM